VQGISYTFTSWRPRRLVADLSPPSRLGQALGWFGFRGAADEAIATLVAERIAHAFGWHTVFVCAAISGALGALLSLLLQEPAPELCSPTRLPTARSQFGVELTFAQAAGVSSESNSLSRSAAGVSSESNSLSAPRRRSQFGVELTFAPLCRCFGRPAAGGAAFGVMFTSHSRWRCRSVIPTSARCSPATRPLRC